MNTEVYVNMETLHVFKSEAGKNWKASIQMSYCQDGGEHIVGLARSGKTKQEAILNIMHIVQIRTKKLMVKLNKGEGR